MYVRVFKLYYTEMIDISMYIFGANVMEDTYDERIWIE